MRSYKGIALQVTERCNLQCVHCSTSSTPWSTRAFSRELLELALTQISKLEPRLDVYFTGGEVFAEKDLLYQGIDLARSLDLGYAITTNGSWGARSDRRRQVLHSIRDCKMLGLSFDTFRMGQLEQRTVVDVFKAALEQGIPAKFRYTLNAKERPEDVLKNLGLVEKKYADLVQFSKLMKIGRARELDADYFPHYEKGAGCLATIVPSIRYTGVVYACCGESFYLQERNPLRLGSLYDSSLSEILSRALDCPTIRAISTVGPQRILDWVVGESGGLVKCDDVAARSPCGSCGLLFQDEIVAKRTEETCRKRAISISWLDCPTNSRMTT